MTGEPRRVSLFSLTFLSSIRPGRNNPRAQRVVSLARAKKPERAQWPWLRTYVSRDVRANQRRPFPRQRNKIPRRLSFHAIMASRERERKKSNAFERDGANPGQRRETCERERERGSMRNMNTFTVIRLIFNTKQRAVRRWHIWSGSMARLRCTVGWKSARKEKKKGRETGGGARLRGVSGREGRARGTEGLAGTGMVKGVCRWMSFAIEGSGYQGSWMLVNGEIWCVDYPLPLGGVVPRHGEPLYNPSLCLPFALPLRSGEHRATCRHPRFWTGRFIGKILLAPLLPPHRASQRCRRRRLRRRRV